MLYHFYCDLRLEPSSQDKPVTLLWHPWTAAVEKRQFVLLRQTDAGFEKVELPKDARNKYHTRDTPDVVSYSGQMFSTVPANSTLKMVTSLPAEYHPLMKAGESYVFMWQGEEIEWWQWGTSFELQGHPVKGDTTNRPSIVLPASNVIGFTARDELLPWPEEAESPRSYDVSVTNRRKQDWRESQREAERIASFKPAPAIVKSTAKV